MEEIKYYRFYTEIGPVYCYKKLRDEDFNINNLKYINRLDYTKNNKKEIKEFYTGITCILEYDSEVYLKFPYEYCQFQVGTENKDGLYHYDNKWVSTYEWYKSIKRKSDGSTVAQMAEKVELSSTEFFYEIEKNLENKEEYAKKIIDNLKKWSIKCSKEEKLKKIKQENRISEKEADKILRKYLK